MFQLVPPINLQGLWLKIFDVTTGKGIVLAGLKACFGGKLEFFDVERKQTTRVQQHLKANHVVWDPSGRYVANCLYHTTGEV